MTTERPKSATAADELETLCTWLDYQRATLEYKCDGLDADDLARRSVVSSGLSLAGLVRHMVRVERNYVRTIFAGENLPEIFGREKTKNAAIGGTDATNAEAAFQIWHDECAASRRIVAAARSLDQMSVNERRSGGHVSLRWLLVFMIQEYARHNGHADLIRETIDGTTGS